MPKCVFAITKDFPVILAITADWQTKCIRWISSNRPNHSIQKANISSIIEYHGFLSIYVSMYVSSCCACACVCSYHTDSIDFDCFWQSSNAARKAPYLFQVSKSISKQFFRIHLQTKNKNKTIESIELQMVTCRSQFGDSRKRRSDRWDKNPPRKWMLYS